MDQSKMKQVLLQAFGIACMAMYLVSFFALGKAYAQTSNPYLDADTQLSSVLDYMQYPLPQNITVSKDGYISFPKAGQNPNKSWADETRYVAAWMFCDNLEPHFVVHTQIDVGKVTLDDITHIGEDRRDRALRSAALSECMASIAYRTACSASAPIQNIGGSTNCHATQAKACHFLKDDPTKGLGIKDIGDDQEANNALTDCDTAGLSPAMYDKIFAHRCDNAAYVQRLGSVLGSAAGVEHAMQFECQMAKDTFEAKLDREKERLLISIQTLLMLREGGHGG